MFCVCFVLIDLSIHPSIQDSSHLNKTLIEHVDICRLHNGCVLLHYCNRNVTVVWLLIQYTNPIQVIHTKKI